MSYILDALRKADAQRERDPSRGIHAHPAPLGTIGSRGGNRPPWVAVAAAVAVVVIAAAAWFLTRDKAATAPAESTANPAPVVAAAPMATPRAPVQAEPATPIETAPAAVIVPPPPPVPVESAEAQRPHPVPRMGGVAPEGPAAMGMQAQPQPMPSPPARANAAPAAPPTAAVTGLPPDAPRIAISGGVYSPSPAQRMLIVNGQVFNEGSEVAPGVTVEAIQPRNAVLKFRGARYMVAY